MDRFLAKDEIRCLVLYEIAEQTFGSFAEYLERKVAPLGDDAVQFIGDPEFRVRYPSIGVGGLGPQEDMIKLGSDILITCFDGNEYWRLHDRFAELGI